MMKNLLFGFCGAEPQEEQPPEEQLDESQLPEVEHPLQLDIFKTSKSIALPPTRAAAFPAG